MQINHNKFEEKETICTVRIYIIIFYNKSHKKNVMSNQCRNDGQTMKTYWNSHLNVINTTNSTYITSFHSFCRNPTEFFIYKKFTDSCISTSVFCGAYLKNSNLIRINVTCHFCVWESSRDYKIICFLYNSFHFN